VDRVSSLPDNLLRLVLRLSDVDVLPRTSLLSHRWCVLWTSLPAKTFFDIPFQY
jgi:hypothetical protein